MGPEPAAPGAAQGRADTRPTASRRAMCVWLGCLASRREGLVRRLVRDAGSVAGVLDQPPSDIVAALTPRGRPRRDLEAPVCPRASGPALARPPGRRDDPNDGPRFIELLAAGPETCLRMMVARPARDRVVAWCDQEYPATLRQLADPPLCLFVRAACPSAEAASRLKTLATEPAVAVVGTRAPSVYGEEMARLLGRDLRREGLVVVSGLALGIDAMAHAAALEGPRGAGLPTVAVLGCGADVAYPRTNTRLYTEIVSEGLIVSEFAWGVRARAWRFPARNRVMAALSRAVVVVEGAQRSGARITAGFALELGRPVLCVPGESGRRLSEAPLQLMREGATVCESAADVLKAMKVEPLSARRDEVSGPADGDDGTEILDYGAGAIRDVLVALGDGPASIDALSRRCGLGVPPIAAAVGELEIDGLVRRVDGGLYRLRRG